MRYRDCNSDQEFGTQFFWPLATGYVLHNVFEPHQLICHLRKRSETHVDLTLARTRYFMVLAFDDNSDPLKFTHHLGTNILKGIGRWYWEITFFHARLIPQVGA